MTQRPAADDHRVIFDASPALIWYKDRHNRILRCNLAAAQSIGKRVEECEGASTYDLYTPEEAAQYYADDMQVILSGMPKLGIIETNTGPDGIRWMRTDKIPYRSANGDIIGVIVFALDITDQKRVEFKLHEALAEADRANRAKSTFLANVSHEIRTPLGVILGFADLLRENDVDSEKRRAYADKIMRNGRRLLGLVNEILDLAKIERGRIAIEPTSFVLKDLVNEATSSIEAKAKSKDLAFFVDFANEVPHYVVTDPARVRQILINLLDNAVKFTDQGVVRLSVSVPKRPTTTGGTMELVFTVEDTGRGIDEHTASELFKPFSQGDQSMARRHGGVGLGLALSRQLAKHLGGDVVLSTSVPGHGSRFSLTIAAREGAPAVEAEHEQLPGLRTAHVLIAEDHPDMREMLVGYLANTPLQVTACSDGDTAVRLAMTERPDVILMDLQLPDIDGTTAMQALRERGFTAPIFAISAHAMKGAREQSLEAGFDEFLPKPIERDALLRALALVIK